MKKVWILVLLISLGLNLGLGCRLYKQARQDRQTGAERLSGRGGREDRPRRPGGGRRQDGRLAHPAPRDTSAWRQIMENRLAMVARRLELSPTQQESFRSVHRRAFAVLRDQRQLIETARQDLHEKIAAETVDPGEIRQLIQILGRRQAEMDSLITETMLQELASLTPEQRVRYLEILPWERGQGGKGSSRKPPRGRLAPPGDQ
jgi:Spy/CpxP family protein refolding chaperone